MYLSQYAEKWKKDFSARTILVPSKYVLTSQITSLLDNAPN